MTSPNEFLNAFLESNAVEKSTIYTCSINENHHPGKFDAPSDWLTQLDDIIQQPTRSTLEEAQDVHSQVFIQEHASFDDHFIEVDCPILNTHNLSVYRYKNYTNTFLFYGIDKHTSTEFLVDEQYIGHDFVIAVFPSTLSGSNIVSIAFEQTLLQVLCTTSVVLFHESSIPKLFTTKSPPPYLPKLSSSLSGQAIRKGYSLRYVEVIHHAASLEELLTKHQPQSLTLPPIFQRLIESDFEFRVDHLGQRIPDPFEADTTTVVEWLIERDKLQSLYMIVGQWKPAVHEALLQLDNRFPLHRFSHLLPSSKLLAEAWRQDPTCWWGQSAALHELLSEST